MWLQWTSRTSESERSRWLKRWHGVEWALPALSRQIPLTLLGSVLGKEGRKILFLPAWVKAEAQSSFRTKGQKPHAGLVVSMATRVPGGVNNPVFQISAALLWWGEKDQAWPLFKFLWISLLVCHVRGTGSFLLHNQQGWSNQLGGIGLNETRQLGGCWAAFGVPCGTQSSVCCKLPSPNRRENGLLCCTPKSTFPWCPILLPGIWIQGFWMSHSGFRLNLQQRCSNLSLAYHNLPTLPVPRFAYL